MRAYRKPFVGFALTVALSASAPGYVRAQQPTTQQQNANAAKAAPGQSIEIDGYILGRNGDTVLVRNYRGGDYNVTLTSATEIKEKKSNPFRGAKTYTQQQLLQGMMVIVSGRGDSSGNIVANKIRFTNSDLRVAQAIDTRVTPVEQNLSQTTNRVSQAEQNAQRMSGQVEELVAVSNAARGGAKAAQASADAAQSSADAAKQSADNALVGVQNTNTRITSIDDYQVKNSAVVNFKVGSAVLSKDAQAQLDKLAEVAKNEKAYVIEVSGYASAEGGKLLNQRLSQRRADEVIRYMAENYDIPLRRFVTPIGLGTTHPIADNATRDGRQANRRVEVKVLTSKGLTQQPPAATETTGQMIK